MRTDESRDEEATGSETRVGCSDRACGGGNGSGPLDAQYLQDDEKHQHSYGSKMNLFGIAYLLWKMRKLRGHMLHMQP